MNAKAILLFEQAVRGHVGPFTANDIAKEARIGLTAVQCALERMQRQSLVKEVGLERQENDLMLPMYVTIKGARQVTISISEHEAAVDVASLAASITKARCIDGGGEIYEFRMEDLERLGEVAHAYLEMVNARTGCYGRGGQGGSGGTTRTEQAVP